MEAGEAVTIFQRQSYINEESGYSVVNDWRLKEITEEKFVDAYYEMTGFDFLKRIRISYPYELKK